MGNWNSGSYQCGRRTLESTLALPAQRFSFDFFEAGIGYGYNCHVFSRAFVAGQYRWSYDAVGNDTMRRSVRIGVHYRDDPATSWRQLSSHIVELVATLTPLGGIRWWWLCPGCGIRRKSLYCPMGMATRHYCRVCHDLQYYSSQQCHKFSGTLGNTGWSMTDVMRVLAVDRRSNIRERELVKRNEYRRHKRRMRARRAKRQL